MMRKAGERLFEAIGQIPEELIMEAERDGLLEEGARQGLWEQRTDRIDKTDQISQIDQIGQIKQIDQIEQAEVNGKLQKKGAKLAQHEERPKDSTNHAAQDVKQSGNQELNAVQDVKQSGNQEPNAVQDVKQSGNQNSQWNELEEVTKGRSQGHQSRMAVIGGYLKYLPVAACLLLVCSGVFYIVNSYIGSDKSFNLSATGGSDGGMLEKSEDLGEAMDGKAEMADDAAGAESGFGGEYSSGAQLSGSASDLSQLLPVRNDTYEGPVLSLTATGDTHNLQTTRRLKGEVVTEEQVDRVQPLLHIEDSYEIKNTSKEDKMLQLVYPFATTLNLAYGIEGKILEVSGQDEKSISYNIGDSIWARRQSAMREILEQSDERGALEQQSESDDLKQSIVSASSMKDYQKLFENTDYQERALEKEADWSREVSVYTFSNIHVQEEADVWNDLSAAGVTVRGAQAEILTYGFDHAFESEEGVSHYCFFIPDSQNEQKQFVMIVTGELDSEPELGFYSNLDCEETVDGIACDINKQKMSYADALRMCSRLEVRNVRQDYEQGIYVGELPEYFGADAVFKALTVIGNEESFYHELLERYHTTELREIYEQLLGETRIVYAMTTVMIPAGQSVQVTAQVCRRQYYGHYMLMNEDEQEQQADHYQFDFMMDDNSRLNVEKTSLRLKLSAEWQIIEENLGLEQKKSVFKAVLGDNMYHFIVSRSFKS